MIFGVPGGGPTCSGRPHLVVAVVGGEVGAAVPAAVAAQVQDLDPATIRKRRHSPRLDRISSRHPRICFQEVIPLLRTADPRDEERLEADGLPEELEVGQEDGARLQVHAAAPAAARGRAPGGVGDPDVDVPVVPVAVLGLGRGPPVVRGVVHGGLVRIRRGVQGEALAVKLDCRGGFGGEGGRVTDGAQALAHLADPHGQLLGHGVQPVRVVPAQDVPAQHVQGLLHRHHAVLVVAFVSSGC